MIIMRWCNVQTNGYQQQSKMYPRYTSLPLVTSECSSMFLVAISNKCWRYESELKQNWNCPLKPSVTFFHIYCQRKNVNRKRSLLVKASEGQPCHVKLLGTSNTAWANSPSKSYELWHALLNGLVNFVLGIIRALGCNYSAMSQFEMHFV